MSEDSPSDLAWSSIARAAAGDRSARSQFGRDYLPVVQTFLDVRWRGTALASERDDAVQDVFLECLRPDGVLVRADGMRGDLRALLFGVTRNVALRYEERARRAIGRDRATSAMLEALPDREAHLSVLFDREWARALMRQTGQRLRSRAEQGDPGARLRTELLRLRFTEGMPIREIAAQWEMEPEAVHRAYRRAREEFRACLREVVAELAVRSEADLEAEVSRVIDLLR